MKQFAFAALLFAFFLATQAFAVAIPKALHKRHNQPPYSPSLHYQPFGLGYAGNFGGFPLGLGAYGPFGSPGFYLKKRSTVDDESLEVEGAPPQEYSEDENLEKRSAKDEHLQKRFFGGYGGFGMYPGMYGGFGMMGRQGFF